MDTMDLSLHVPKHPTSPVQMKRCRLGPEGYQTDHRLKWKPPSENSIDFRIELRFPPSPLDPSRPDFHLKPTCLLYTWLGGEEYEFFDDMELEDEEWESWKQSGEQYDDRIIEVCWDAHRGTWKYLRIRDDKPHANHKDIMKKILISIEDGVEIEAVSFDLVSFSY